MVDAPFYTVELLMYRWTLTAPSPLCVWGVCVCLRLSLQCAGRIPLPPHPHQVTDTTHAEIRYNKHQYEAYLNADTTYITIVD